MSCLPCPTMVYAEFLDNITAKFERLYEEVDTEHNFELGTELEVALCKLLRLMLPERYGVCRGYVVGQDGATAGDDVIVYDRQRFAPLRLIESDLAQKQRIPVEAVYAYVEVKHTLYLNGNGGQSIAKAREQVAAVKAIRRRAVPLNQVDPYLVIGTNATRQRVGWPHTRNPLFCAILSRNVELGGRGSELPVSSHLDLVARVTSRDPGAPDMIVAGPDLVCLPAIGQQVVGPFQILDETTLRCVTTPGRALASGLANLSYAIDSITLGSIHWPSVIASGLGVELEGDPE